MLVRYLMRPNSLTVHKMIRPAFASVFPRGLPRNLASVFVRWGDKGSEVVQLEDIDSHFAPLLLQNVSHVYVGSDSQRALDEAMAKYGKRFNLFYLKHSRPTEGAENYKRSYTQTKGTDAIIEQMKVSHTVACA